MKTYVLAHRMVPVVSMLALAAAAHADVKLPAVISDHMVLQQGVKANVWGKADAGEKVTVKLGDKSVETVADGDGKWSVRLENLPAGPLGDMTISGKNTVTVKDVVAGEVWVASGQSNMEWIVQNSGNPKEEIANAKWPMIRMFTVQKAVSATPKEDVVGKWEVCTPETAGHFSAVGYYFARRLHQTLQAPVGIIHTSWGGTPAQHWTPREVMERDPELKVYVEGWDKVKEAYPAAKAKYDEAMEKWKAAAEAAKAEGKKAPPQPRAPRGGDDFGAPGCLYYAMIAPLVPYTIQGAIWYQGESNANAGDAPRYRKLFGTMIMSWRAMWSQGGRAGSDDPHFPFLFVQLANFQARHDQPTDSHWAHVREAQLQTLELPRTGMAVAIDIGEEKDIHPKNKQEVGRRLALNAEALVYFKDTEFSGPLFSGSQVEDGKIRLSFRNAEGLKPADGEKLKGFAIAGEDQKFVWADAQIQGDHIVVSSPAVPNPVAVRYAWANNPEANLVNKEGLPASPFRTDDWPQKP